MAVPGFAVPGFDIQGGMALALVRGVSVAALFSAFGTLLFGVAVAPPVLACAENARAIAARLQRLALWSLLATIFATLAWLVLESGAMADARSAGASLGAVPVVARATFFGHLLLARVGVLLLALLAGWRGWFWPAAFLAAAATALQAGHSHAFAMYGATSPLLASDALHLLAAGAWLGGLAPLLIVVGSGSADTAFRASRRFSPMAMLCVAVLVATAAFQFWLLISGLPGLIGTGYGWVALVKIVLLLVLLGFANRNRFRYTPGLRGVAPDAARARLRRSIALETCVGVLVVLAAGVLTSLPPAMHAQPVWPFAVRPSLITVQEDPDFRREVVGAMLALGGALALLAAGLLMRRRFRWLAFSAAIAVAWFAVPHLDPLFVQAYPTSYQHSPTGFTASAIARGAALYPLNCAACHGAEGRGDGPDAKDLPVPPADLTAAHLWMHSDGELIWWLSHGIEAPRGGMAMPGFANVLSEQDLWDLIDYIRAQNAGMMMRGMGMWSPPVRAPDFPLSCKGTKEMRLSDLRGEVVRLVIGGAPAIQQGDVRTVIVGTDMQAVGDTCVSTNPAVPRAYAVVSGMAASALKGTEFLIDENGWLRAVQRTGWIDRQSLAAELRQIRMHPLGNGEGGSHQHMAM